MSVDEKREEAEAVFSGFCDAESAIALPHIDIRHVERAGTI